MNPQLLDAILKSDDSATVEDMGDGTIVLETTIDLVESGVVRESLGKQLEDALIDSHLLDREDHAQLPDVGVRVVRTMFAVHAGFSACIMIFAYTLFYLLQFDTGGGGPAIFTTVSSGVGALLFYALMLLVVHWHEEGFACALMPPFLGGFALSILVLVGGFAALLGTITPLQAATISFAQCLAVYGYTLSSPDYINTLQSFLYMVIAAIVVWLFGLYGFIVQRAWISSGALVLFGAGNAGYLTWQIAHSPRYCLSDPDLRRAVYSFYLDPALIVIEKIKRG